MVNAAGKVTCGLNMADIRTAGDVYRRTATIPRRIVGTVATQNNAVRGLNDSAVRIQRRTSRFNTDDVIRSIGNNITTVDVHRGCNRRNVGAARGVPVAANPDGTALGSLNAAALERKDAAFLNQNGLSLRAGDLSADISRHRRSAHGRLNRRRIEDSKISVNIDISVKGFAVEIDLGGNTLCYLDVFGDIGHKLNVLALVKGILESRGIGDLDKRVLRIRCHRSGGDGRGGHGAREGHREAQTEQSLFVHVRFPFRKPRHCTRAFRFRISKREIDTRKFIQQQPPPATFY